MRTRGTGPTASGPGGTQHVFRARVGTVRSPVSPPGAHTARCPGKRRHPGCVPLGTGSFRPGPKRPLVHRDEGEEISYLLTVLPGTALAMYFEDFSDLSQDLFRRQTENSLPDGWGEYRTDEKFQ